MAASPTGRIAVVSGGTAGIGLATARHLLDAGDRVAIFSRNTDHVEMALRELSGPGTDGRVFARPVDLREPDSVEDFFAELKSKWGAPTVLVCNAGVSPRPAEGNRRPVGDVPLSEWRDVLAVNLTGALLCCQAALPGMVAAEFGRIVLIGSLASRGTPRVASAGYVAAKAALSGLARSLVGDYSRFGITTNVVAPGRILSDMTGDASSPTNTAALVRIPAGRLGSPDDVAVAVSFLVSNAAGFINGASLDVNGGEFVPA